MLTDISSVIRRKGMDLRARGADEYKKAMADPERKGLDEAVRMVRKADLILESVSPKIEPRYVHVFPPRLVVRHPYIFHVNMEPVVDAFPDWLMCFRLWLFKRLYWEIQWEKGKGEQHG